MMTLVRYEQIGDGRWRIYSIYSAKEIFVATEDTAKQFCELVEDAFEDYQWHAGCD